MIEIKDVKKVPEHFKCSYILINQNEEIIEQNEVVNSPLVHIINVDE